MKIGREASVGGGLVKGLAKILGAGGKSAATALKGALEDLPASLRLRLASSGLLKGVEGATQRRSKGQSIVRLDKGADSSNGNHE